jgi:hypothetical protein
VAVDRLDLSVARGETLALLSHLLGDETIRQLATPSALAKAAKDRGLGREIPTDWFLQDIKP